jgi:hypothetical protein
MRKVLKNTELYRAYVDQTQPTARNQSGMLMFEGIEIFACELDYKEKNKYTKKILIGRRTKPGFLITNKRLYGNSISQRRQFVWFLGRIGSKFFVVENLNPLIEEHHILNLRGIEKVVRRRINEAMKMNWKIEGANEAIAMYMDYVKIFNLSNIDTSSFDKEKMIFRLTAN